MDDGYYNVVYFDRRSTVPASDELAEAVKWPDGYAGHDGEQQQDRTSADLVALRSVFPEVHVHASVSACVEKCASLGKALAAPPIILIIQTTHDEPKRPGPGDLHRSISPKTVLEPPPRPPPQESDDLCGLKLLQHVQAELKQRAASTICVPIVVLNGASEQLSIPNPFASDNPQRTASSNQSHSRNNINIARYLDAGAVDVIPSPLSHDRLLSLPAIAYRAAKDATRRASLFGPDTIRKRSWCGVDHESRPYAYLREAMVSGLMDGICNPDYVDQGVDATAFHIDPTRVDYIESAVGSWAFCAHDFDEDELIHAVLTMLKHALKVPALQKWHMNDERLISFLLATRKVYNSFVLYHNFRHACDVCQALFYFLLKIEALPPYPNTSTGSSSHRTPLAKILDPFHALTMLVAAIGHDVGHPGVNNLFLVTLNAPLAQLYSDRSVLECFHCAAYTQILRRYWPVAFSDTSMRKFMVNAILATDMGVHAKYIDSLAQIQESLSKTGNAVEEFDEKTLDNNRDLLCCLLIKCADICNAARPINIATQWAQILIDEFANQGDMERELNIPSCLYGGPPVRNDISKLAMSQIGFMDMFAIPLFGGMTAVFPSLHFGVDELKKNRKIWEHRVEEARDPASKPRASMAGIETMPTFASKAELENVQSLQHHPSDPNPAISKNLQMRPVKALSPPASPKSSGGHQNHFNGLPSFSFDPNRRPSLGPTVMATQDSPTATKSAGPPTPGPFPGVTPARAMASVRQLDGAQPEIHSPPPHSRPGERDSDAGKVPYLTSAVRTGSSRAQKPAKSDAKTALLAATSNAEETGGSSPEPSTAAAAGQRGRNGRKSGGFSFRFWRKKSRSGDAALNYGPGGQKKAD